MERAMMERVLTMQINTLLLLINFLIDLCLINFDEIQDLDYLFISLLQV